jgi:hypothetical protein
MRRGAAKQFFPTTVPCLQHLQFRRLVPRIPHAVLEPPPTELARPHRSHQPHSLRVMASERVLNDDRHNKSLFNIVDKGTAMKNNSIVKEIKSQTPMDDHTFLTKVKLTLCNLLEQNRNTKIKLKLTCIMTRTDLATGQEQDEEAIFWSETHENFPATDLNDLYEIMKENVLDAFATYLNK